MATAGSATEAMNKLALIPGGVDAVIIDIGLPDRRGDDLGREILAMYSSLPILLATGQDLADLRLAFQGKKVAFVAKPYTEADLLGSLRVFGLDPISR